jgi:hypothetical protein
MGFYTNTFNIVRQSIAVSIFFFSIPYLLDNRKIKYFSLAFLSASMHFSALSLFIIYPFVHKNISFRKIVLFFAVVLFLYILSGTSLLYSVLTLLFAKQNPDVVLDTMSGSGWNLLILYGFLFVIFYLFYKNNRKNLAPKVELEFKMLVLFQMFVTSFQLFATMYSTVMRLGMFYFIPTIVTLPRIYALAKSRLIKFCILFASLVLYLFFFYKTYSYDEGTGSNSQAVIPYVFFEN